MLRECKCSLLIILTKIRRERTRADDLQKKIKAEADQAKADEKMHQELEDLRNDKKLLKDNLQVDISVCLAYAYFRRQLIGLLHAPRR